MHPMCSIDCNTRPNDIGPSSIGTAAAATTAATIGQRNVLKHMSTWKLTNQKVAKTCVSNVLERMRVKNRDRAD